MLKKWRRRRSCPHVHLHGIYGDPGLHTEARLYCADCGRHLRGPVMIAQWREDEAAKLAAWHKERGLSVASIVWLMRQGS